MKRLLLATVISAVEAEYGLQVTSLVSARRHKSVALGRHVAMYLCRKHCGASYPEIGQAFGNRDHSTVMSAVGRVRGLLETNWEVVEAVAKIERKLDQADGHDRLRDLLAHCDELGEEAIRGLTEFAANLVRFKEMTP